MFFTIWFLKLATDPRQVMLMAVTWLEQRDTRQTCSTDPCGTVGASGKPGTPGAGRLCRCHSGRSRVPLA